MKLIKPYILGTAFIAGFVLMGFEIFGSRVLQPYFGNGIHIWGALIAVFMAGLSLGYLLGGKIADKYQGYRPLSLLLLIPGLFLMFFPFYGKSFCMFADSWQKDERIETLLAAMLLFFLPTICIGAVSPYLVKMNTLSMDKLGSSNGTVFAITTAGSIIGTLASAFYFIGRIRSTSAIALMGVILLSNAFICWVLSRRKLNLPA